MLAKSKTTEPTTMCKQLTTSSSTSKVATGVLLKMCGSLTFSEEMTTGFWRDSKSSSCSNTCCKLYSHLRNNDELPMSGWRLKELRNANHGDFMSRLPKSINCVVETGAVEMLVQWLFHNNLHHDPITQRRQGTAIGQYAMSNSSKMQI